MTAVATRRTGPKCGLSARFGPRSDATTAVVLRNVTSRPRGAMELSFATKQLRSEALDRSCAEQAHGEVVARALHARLSDLDAAVRITDLPRVSSWRADGTKLRVRLLPGLVLVCEPVPVQTEPVDWSKVHRLMVWGIQEE